MTESPRPLSATRLAIVGAGAMAEAILAGLLERELLPADRITCSHPREARRTALAQTYGVATAAENATAVGNADTVLIAVKPQVLPAVMAELAASLAPSQVVVSVVAGATTRALGEGLRHPDIVRAMPNTPSQIGRGVTVWYATPSVSEAGQDRVRSMLVALGHEMQVADEGQVAMATALSGTGPTYMFLFVEALLDAGVHLGFPRHVARELVLETMIGSAQMALRSGKHVAELRDMVTSPGGTSAEATYQMEAGRLRTVLSDAVWAAYTRTRELEARLEGRPLSERRGARPV